MGIDTPLTRWLSPPHLRLLGPFLRFGVVGVLGFVVDTATVYATMGWVGLYGAGLLAYLVAASVNWGINRVWTFRGQGSGPAYRQWGAFLAANLVGFGLNRGAYFSLIFLSPVCAAHPVLAVAAGAIAGLAANFHLSRTRVFR